MITNIEQMIAKAGAKEVQLSGWEGDEITVMLKKPSLYEMAASGSIPNPLLGIAEALFVGNQDTIKRTPIDEVAKTLRSMAKKALVNPTWDELQNAGIELTDQQINEIYAFIVGGAAQLERFRAAERNSIGGNG